MMKITKLPYGMKTQGFVIVCSESEMEVMLCGLEYIPGENPGLSDICRQLYKAMSNKVTPSSQPENAQEYNEQAVEIPSPPVSSLLFANTRRVYWTSGGR